MTSTVLPPTLALPERICETSSTPGAFATASAALLVSGSPSRRRPRGSSRPRKSSSTASMNEVLKPWPMTATNVISASPIMTAAAVDAVRAGFRTAFWRASLPAAPPKRAPGAPST